jgi:hypothetical protein
MKKEEGWSLGRKPHLVKDLRSSWNTEMSTMYRTENFLSQDALWLLVWKLEHGYLIYSRIFNTTGNSVWNWHATWMPALVYSLELWSYVSKCKAIVLWCCIIHRRTWYVWIFISYCVFFCYFLSKVWPGYGQTLEQNLLLRTQERAFPGLNFKIFRRAMSPYPPRWGVAFD